MVGFVDRLAEYITDKITRKDYVVKLPHELKEPSIDIEEFQKIENLTNELDKKEKELFKKKALLEGILNSQHDCIVRTLKDGTITYCNETYHDIFHSAEKCAGICIYESVHPDFLKEVQNNHVRYFNSPYVSSIEALLETIKGYK
jgi:PAS domain-containing protein